ncbi:25804_t:CDS:2, partial [Gigaspora margarita]
KKRIRPSLRHYSECNNKSSQPNVTKEENLKHRKRSKVKTELEKSILILGKIIRSIRDGKLNLEIGLLQPQSLDEEEQNLRGWKKILEKKCLTENTISRNKEIQNKVKKHCEMIVNNQGQISHVYNRKAFSELVSKEKCKAKSSDPKVYKPTSYVQESLYENLLEEISDKE